MGDEEIQKMVTLLLSRATMLAQHCPACGTVLFEQGGRIICPSCGELEVREEGQEEKGKEEEREKEQEGGGDEEVLRRKRSELIAELEGERDLDKVLRILEAVQRIDSILGGRR